MISKKLIFASLIILVMVAIVSAIASITYSVESAIIENNGVINYTGTPVSGFSVVGFICQNPSCSTVNNSQLFPGQPLFAPGSFIVLDFPTLLQSPFGYGIYFYKENYIPGEVLADWANSGTDQNQSYLYKQRNCPASINIPTITNTSSSLKFNITMQSPIFNSGLLSYVPPAVADQYLVSAAAYYNVTGTDGTSLVGNSALTLPYSGFGTSQFTIPASSGVTYNITVLGKITDLSCLNTTDSVLSTVFTIPSNETNQSDLPPALITDLNATEIGINYIIWTWTNPNDTDFSYNLIYLDGSLIANTNSSTSLFNVTSLLPNTTYTITLKSVDTAGNINLGVSNAATTLPITPNSSDTIPPGAVSNLQAVELTENSIKWTWTNPNDTDFAYSIIYLDGINIFNTTTQTYTAQSLAQNTTYTLLINTIDIHGNINNTAVSSTAMTLASNSSSGEESDGNGGGETKKKVLGDVAPAVNVIKNLSYTAQEEQVALNAATPQNNFNWLWIFVILSALILIIILLVILSKIAR